MPLNHTFLPSTPPRNEQELSKMINLIRNSKTSAVSETFKSIRGLYLSFSRDTWVHLFLSIVYPA